MEQTDAARQIRIAAIKVYLFSRSVRKFAHAAEAEFERRGICRNYRIPVIDQLEDEIRMGNI